MGELLMRRREMMAVKNETNHLLYSLENQAVSVGTLIRTGVHPFASGADLTILFDFDMTTNTTSGNSRLWKLIYCTDWKLVIGKSSGSATVMTCWWMGGNAGLNNAYTSAARHRIAVTHQAGSDTLSVSYRYNTGTRRNQTFTGTFAESSTVLLFFGGGENHNYSLPPGTITNAKVYDIVLTAEEINAFFA